MLGSYQKYFKTSLDDVLWKTTWINLVMNLASIPPLNSKAKEDGVEYVKPENEGNSLRDLLG